MGNIAFNEPFLTGEELDYMRQSIAGGHICGNGPFSRQCCALLERLLAVPKAVLTTSGTHALEMAALLLDLQPGDEVILPSFTFVSTANAFVLRGARPIFCDIRPDTLNLDANKLATLVTTRTKAIVAVHYAGVGCEMDAILDIASRSGIAVIEDNAHGLFGKYRGKQLGTFGCLGAQSFHETKNFSCGEGGCLLVNEAQYIERAEIILEKGTNRSRFFRGQVDKYTWVDIGSSYVLSDMLAAYLLAQLQGRDEIQTKRQQMWGYYHRNLRVWASLHGVDLPTVPPHCEQAYHMFYMVMPSHHARQAMIEHLRSHGVASVFHYLPLHLSLMGRRYGGKEGDCPVAEDVSDRLLRLPFHCGLSEADLATVVNAVSQFFLSAHGTETIRPLRRDSGCDSCS